MALMFPRLARNFVKNGYFPTDEPTLERALNALMPSDGPMCILDPCAGEGVAIAEAAHALGREQAAGLVDRRLDDVRRPRERLGRRRELLHDVDVDRHRRRAARLARLRDGDDVADVRRELGPERHARRVGRCRRRCFAYDELIAARGAQRN